MKLKLLCKPVCETCKGKGEHIRYWLEKKPKVPMVKCSDCNGEGYTDKVMVFEWGFEMWWEDNIGLELVLDEKGIWLLESATDKDITESSNPQYIEFISVDDCPTCEGDGWMHNLSGEDEAYENRFKGDKCENCTDGKIERSDGFHVFGSKEEYDHEIWEEARGVIKDEFKKLKAELKEDE